MEGGNPGTLVVPEKCYLFVDRYVVPGETDEICVIRKERPPEVRAFFSFFFF